MVKEKVLLVIAPSNFRDEELFHTKEELEKAGYLTVVASTSTKEARGMLGGSIKPSILVSDAKVEDYGAVVFVGGSGVEENGLPENPSVIALAKNAYAKGKVVGAICIAPRILANAGILSGKNATAFKDSKTLSILQNAGANYTGKSVEQDGKIITANGPSAARAFGEKIAEAMKG